MKKNKIFLLLFIGLCTLFISNKVKAADNLDNSIIGWHECVYDVVDSKYLKKFLQNGYYGKNNKDQVVIGYTDIKVIDSREENYRVEIPHFFNRLYSADEKILTFSIETDNKFYEGFRNQYLKSNKICPKVIYYDLSGKKFSYYNSKDNIIVGEVKQLTLNEEQTFIKKIYPEEQSWSLEINASNVEHSGPDCTVGKTATLFISNINGTNYLKANIDGETVNAYMSVFSSIGDNLRSLVLNNELVAGRGMSSKLTGNINFSNKYLEIGDSAGTYGETCNLNKPQKLELKMNCVDNFDELEKKVQDMEQAKSDLKELGEKYTLRVDEDGNWIPRDFESVTDENSLSNEYVELRSKYAVYSVPLETDINSMLSKYNGKVCSDKKDDYSNVVDQYNDSYQAVAEYLEFIKTVFMNMAKRLEKLEGDKELIDGIYDYIEHIDEEVEKVKVDKNLISTTQSLLNNSNVTITQISSGCDVLGGELQDWLLQLMDIIKIAALVLTIIFGMIDFFKGALSGDAQAMEKMWKNFSNRLIAVALLFLLPLIIEFVLGLITINGVDASNPLCSIKK